VDGGAIPPVRPGVQAFDWVHVMRPRFFDGFHRSIRAMADAGNDLIVDHIIEYPSWREQLAGLLAGLDVFLVGVHCDAAELSRRELARGDRRPGEALEHVEVDRIHDFVAYDVSVDTTEGVDDALVARIVSAWRARDGQGALFRG
jgi:chloramphenicol 3-O phosphotransferase